MPTPTPTANPYGPQLAAPAPNNMSSGAAVPAPVSTVTPSSVIEANLAAAKAQNLAMAKADGKVGGSRKQKRSRNKRRMRSNRHKRTNRSNRSNRSNRRRRSKRGGATTPSITPRPTATVPQFGQNAGANAASLSLNSGAMGQTAQAKYDNINGPSTTTYFQ